jgi:hypothetical protein
MSRLSLTKAKDSLKLTVRLCCLVPSLRRRHEERSPGRSLLLRRSLESRSSHPLPLQLDLARFVSFRFNIQQPTSAHGLWFLRLLFSSPFFPFFSHLSRMLDGQQPRHRDRRRDPDAVRIDKPSVLHGSM